MGVDWTAVLQTLIVAGVPAVAKLIERWMNRRSRKRAETKQIDR
jgi:hypothetical protein